MQWCKRETHKKAITGMECGDGGGYPGRDRGECRNEVKTQKSYMFNRVQRC